ncbi:MAG: hypothetical protein Q9178_002980 [Gyalolechia marmorata]
MAEIRDNGPHVLPFSDKVALKRVYTGVGPIDYQLTTLMLFFYNILDGSHPHASLQAYQFVGQLITGWSLLVLESLRESNRGRLISFKLSDFLPHPAKLQSIPYSITIGFVTPTILMALPAPSVISYEKKQLFIAIWQAFPLWVGICQIGIPVLRSLFIDDVTPKRTNTQIIDSMRRIYATMLVVAVVTRISSWTISISAILFPGIFAPEVGSLLKPSKVFGPAAATPSVKMPSLAAGSFQLLQYDEMIGGTAMVLWSASLYSNAIGSKGLADWASLAMKGIVILALAGPQGLAVAAVWARDEIIFASHNQKEKSL